MICYFLINSHFQASNPCCFYIMNRVSERHIYLACVICYKTISTLTFKIMKETLKSYVEYSRNKFVVLRDLLNFGIQLLFKIN